MSTFPDRYVVAIGLGANLGDREATLRSAALEIETLARPGGSSRVSALYETEPVGPPQPTYLNAAVRLGVELAPDALLDALLAIEAAHGRVRRERWGPRTLDLDVLWAADATDGPLSFRSERLAVPHPHLLERAFALAPLLDVMPELDARLGPALAVLGGPPRVVARGSRPPADWPWARTRPA